MLCSFASGLADDIIIVVGIVDQIDIGITDDLAAQFQGLEVGEALALLVFGAGAGARVDRLLGQLLHEVPLGLQLQLDLLVLLPVQL